MSTVTEDDPRIVYLPFNRVGEVPDGFCHNFKNRWWSVHPERGLMFWKPIKSTPKYAHPQCNINEDCALRLQERLYPWAELRFVPLVCVPADPRDYI